MSQPRSTFVFLAALLTSVLAAVFAGSASAGGPTSVILVVPGAGRTASLYNGSADYEALSQLLRIDPNDEAQPADSPGMEDSRGVTVTWLIHDVQVWRVDEIDLSGEGGPWVSTREDMGGSNIWDAPVQRHRVSDGGTALAALLDRLGLTQAVAKPVAAQPVTADIGGSATSSAAPGTAGIPGAAERWSWGVAGLVLGSALTLGSILLGRRWSAHPRAEPTMATAAAEVLDSGAR